MATHTLDIGAFRAMFPQFSEALYPDAVIQMWWDMASCAMSADDSCVISGDCLQTAIYLLMAHIGTLLTRAIAGNTSVGNKTQATIDKVTVAYSVPPYKNGWQAYLGQTPFGMQLWFLLEGKSAGGWYFGGRDETSAFRKVRGRF